MKRHIIWIVAATAAVGLAAPALAAMQPAGTDDDGTPGDVRGNCDELEHAGDAGCLGLVVGAGAAPSVGTTATTAPDVTVRRSSTPDRAAGTVPSTSVLTTVADVSGPCDEAEHANDPRCTTATRSGAEDSGGGGDDDAVATGRADDHGDDDGGLSGDGRADDSGHHGDDDRAGDDSGHGGDDDRGDDDSGHGGDDDRGDDDSGHGGDDDRGGDDSGHGSDDD